MLPPNIIFLVWDACRLDAAKEYAPTLMALASDNIWFELAVTPAGWSLPAHVSLFTGTYPHEHGIYRVSDRIESLSLLSKLEKEGYNTYGVSANGFASPSYGFSDGFNEFASTHDQMVFVEGLDVHKYAKRNKKQNDGDFNIDIFHVLRTALSHRHPLKSLANVATAGLSKMTNSHPVVSRIPHPRFNQNSGYCYDPNQNTSVISSIIEEEAKTNQPFFIFSNYMDTHWPYNPPSHLLRKHLNDTLSYRELVDLNEAVKVWEYAKKVHQGATPENEIIEHIRQLYQAEVESLDNHLAKIVEQLKKNGLYDNTLLVVTADHGENLGHNDELGENWFGHESSGSDALLRVPLLIAHPHIEDETVTSWFSTKDIVPLLTENKGTLIKNEWGTENETDNIVLSEYPSDGRTKELESEHPEIPRRFFARDLVVGYLDDWKVAVISTGKKFAWNCGKKKKPEEAPEKLLRTCHYRVRQFAEESEARDDLGQEVTNRLKRLGYL